MVSEILKKSIADIPNYLKQSTRLYVLVTDLTGNYAYVNPYFQKRFEFVTDNFIGKPITYATHIGDLDKCSTAVNTLMQNPDEFVNTIIRKPSNHSGDYFYSEWQFSFIKDEQNMPIGVLCIGNDVTEVESVKQKMEIAELANKAKSQFLANMSHEIRTPLNAVLGFSGLLTETPLNEQQKKYVEVMQSSANLLRGLVNDILDFSKIESGKMHLYFENINLKELIENTASIIEDNCAKQNNKLIVEFDSLIQGDLSLDKLRLQQVLLNLLSNAAKFTSNGTIHLIAKYIKESNQNVEVLFEVKDTGKGIAKNKLSEVFKDFTQEDQSTFNKYGGTGLGLNIANKLVRMMGGEGILLQSELGIGSSFSFKLSIVKSSADNSKDLLFSRVYEEHISILIVDDNSINVLIAEKILKKHFVNAIVYKCYSGKEALEILENTSGDVNVILMDVYMPDMDGYECTKKIKNNLNWQNIPIIALTASDTTEERLKTKQEGFVDFVAKPILPEKLSVAIHESLKNIQNG
jgi:PAS domain S-box-containing protein